MGVAAGGAQVELGVVGHEAQAIEHEVQRLHPDRFPAAHVQRRIGVDLLGDGDQQRVVVAAHLRLLAIAQRIVGNAHLRQRLAGGALEGIALDPLVEEGQADEAFLAGIPLAAQVEVGRDVRVELGIALAAGIHAGAAEGGRRQHRAGVGAAHRLAARHAQHHVVGHVPGGAERRQPLAVVALQVLPLAHAAEGDRAADGLVGGGVTHAGVDAQFPAPDVAGHVELRIGRLVGLVEAAGGLAEVACVDFRCGGAVLGEVGGLEERGVIDADEAARAADQVLRQVGIGDLALRVGLPRRLAVEGLDAAQVAVGGHADPDVVAVVAELQVGAQVRGLGQALFVLQAQVVPGPAQARIVEVQVRGDDREAVVVGVLAGEVGRVDHDGRHHAAQPAAADAGVHVELDVALVAEPEGGARVHLPVVHVLGVGTGLQEYLRAGESSVGDHAVAVDLHVQRDHAGGRTEVASQQVQVEAVHRAVRLRVQGVHPDVHAVARTPFGRAEERIAVAVAGHVQRASQRRDQRIVDLGDAQARVVREQPVLVDGLARGQAGADHRRVVGHHRPDAPAVRDRGAAAAALRGGQRRRGPVVADAVFPAFHAHLALDRGHAGKHAERARIVGPAADERALRRHAAGDGVVGALQRIGEVLARVVEGVCVAHVHQAGGAAFRQAGLGRLVDGQRVEELGREQGQVGFAVLVLLVQADRRGGDRIAVDRGLGEVLAQAADGDLHAFAVDVAVDLDARDAAERFGDVGIRELADVLGEDRIGEAGGIALGIGGELDAVAVAGHRDGIQLGRSALLWSRTRLRVVVLLLGLLRPQRAAGRAQQGQPKCVGQRGLDEFPVHRNSPSRIQMMCVFASCA